MEKTFTNLLDLARKTKVPESGVGYAIMAAAVANKDRNKEIYYQGDSRSDYFKKREYNQIYSDLERLVTGSIFSRSGSGFRPDEAMVERIKKNIINKGEIFTVSFVFDALVYLSSRGVSLEDMASMIGSAAYTAAAMPPEPDKAKNLRQCYENLLTTIRKSITEKFHVYLEPRK